MADKPPGFPWLNVEFKHQAPKSEIISIRDWLFNAILPAMIVLGIMRLLAWLLA